MNRTAKDLKLFHTNFANPHGLSNLLNCSTAADMLTLSRYACENIDFRKIVGTEAYSCEYLSESMEDIVETKEWRNTNKLLERGWEGIKTGHTIPAGACLASVRDSVYIVVLNCSNVGARFDETEIIFAWFKSFFKWKFSFLTWLLHNIVSF